MGISGPVGPSLSENPTSCTNPSGGAVYYIDGASGNDSNNGTSTASAWKTLTKLSNSMSSITPGTMICIKRGSIYRGSLTISVSGSSSLPILVDAYGPGSAPVISGLDAVTGSWTVHSGNIYKTTIATGLSPKQLQVGGAQQKLARHPNSGWLTTDDKTATTVVDSWIGTQTAGSLVGANLVVRGNPWAWGAAPVTGHSGSTVTIASPGLATFIGTQAGWAYGLENKLSFLDSAGEWYYNSTTGELYLWAPGNANPNSLSVEVAVRANGILLGYGRSNIHFKNLVFEGYSGAITQEGNQKRMLYENLEMRNSVRAFLLWTEENSVADGNIIRNNYVHDIFQDAVALFGGNGHTFEGNVVRNVGLDPWTGANIDTWGLIGLNTGTSNQTVRRNIVENIGYTGMFVNGSGLIEENVFEDMLMAVTDGAGIMFNVADGLTIRKNIVKNVLSNTANMPQPYPTYDAIGNAFYYGDDSVKNTTVEGNIAINIGNDAYVMDHGAEYTNNKTINNIAFNFKRGGIFLTDASLYRDEGASYGASYMQLCEPYTNSPCFKSQFNDIVTGNKLYGFEPDGTNPNTGIPSGSRGIYMFYTYSNGSGGHTDYGTINNNYYYNKLSPARVTTRWPVIPPFTTTDHTLAQWRTLSGEDINSTDSAYPASSTRPDPQIFYNQTLSAITQSVNGCNANGTPLTGNQTIQPFTALVVEYGNC